MSRRRRLTQSMTEAEFDNGYWYATELRDFAIRVGVPSASKLRKDELEAAIRHLIRTGKVRAPTKRATARSGVPDLALGLRLDLPVVNYTSSS